MLATLLWDDVVALQDVRQIKIIWQCLDSRWLHLYLSITSVASRTFSHVIVNCAQRHDVMTYGILSLHKLDESNPKPSGKFQIAISQSFTLWFFIKIFHSLGWAPCYGLGLGSLMPNHTKTMPLRALRVTAIGVEPKERGTRTGYCIYIKFISRHLSQCYVQTQWSPVLIASIHGRTQQCMVASTWWQEQAWRIQHMGDSKQPAPGSTRQNIQSQFQ